MKADKFDGSEFGDIDAVAVRKHMFDHVDFVAGNLDGSIIVSYILSYVISEGSVPWHHMDDIIQKALNNTYKTYSCSSHTAGMCRIALVNAGLLKEVNGADKNGRVCNVYVVPKDCD